MRVPQKYKPELWNENNTREENRIALGVAYGSIAKIMKDNGLKCRDMVRERDKKERARRRKEIAIKKEPWVDNPNYTIFTGGHDGGDGRAVLCNEGEMV